MGLFERWSLEEPEIKLLHSSLDSHYIFFKMNKEN